MRLWWVRTPLAARRVSVTAMLGLLDGYYLTAWPQIARILSPLMLLIGCGLGWSHLGFETTLSQSLIVTLLLVIVGVLSGHLGLWFLAGFVIGDFLFATHETFRPHNVFEHLLFVRLPLLIEYGLLFFLLVLLPLLTKSLIVSLHPPGHWSDSARFNAALIGHVVVTALLVFLWSQTTPLLIRPVFTWQGDLPPAEAVVPLQGWSWLLVLVGVVASVGRMCAQRLTVERPALRACVDRWQAQFTGVMPAPPLPQRIAPWLRAIVAFLWSTFMLSGLFQTWSDPLLLAPVILLLQAARAGAITIPLGRWPQSMERLPLLARLSGGVVLVLIIMRLGLRQDMLSHESFRPVTVLTAITLVIFFLLVPARPRTAAQGGKS
jgi:hypothetical protein